MVAWTSAVQVKKTAFRHHVAQKIALPSAAAPTILPLQMTAAPKLIYLFLSSEKDFAAFCSILTKTRKVIAIIDSIGITVFSMVLRKAGM